jgi:hypothetical protein
MGISPGTTEGRKKGGRISQLNRKNNPDHYLSCGCFIAKKIQIPKNKIQIAELIGIILGDGGITQGQIHITLNSISDRQYANYVRKLIENLFCLKTGMYKKKNANANVIYVSGVNLIKYMISKGLMIGNKVKNQVDAPNWIKQNIKLSTACLRGLIDTDGGIFFHNYTVKKKPYSYLKLSFTNKSLPLLNFVHKTLSELNFHPKFFGNNRVWLYSEKEVKTYLKTVGSSNNRLSNKLKI